MRVRSRRTSAERARKLLRCCDEGNAYVNKSLVQALESCPSDVTPPAKLSTFSCENLKSAGLANTYMPKTAILREPCC